MRISKKTVKSLIFIALFLGTLTLSLALYKFFVNRSPFLVTASPKGTYIVKLTGQKERPYFFTNEVRFHVFKSEEPFLINKHLHSGDAFDLSFELGYPNYQWLDENVLHFYNEKILVQITLIP